jgi:pyruvate kinase
MRTKIIITIGSKSEDKKILLPLLTAGVDIVRVNFSHASQEQYKRVRKIVSDFNKNSNKKIAMLLDLQGPRIRIGKMPPNGIILKDNEIYNFLYSKKSYQPEGIIPIDNEDLSQDMKKGQPLFLCNGEIELKVTKISGKIITGQVVHGGLLTSNKAVNVPDTNMRKGGLTTKDVKDLNFGLKAGVEYVGLSFVQTASDILKLRKQIGKKSNVKIIAKIERGVALKNIDRIIRVSDFIMIARGDLGVETPIEDLPLVQKNLIRHAHWYNIPAIIATQVMTSMIKNPVPTRAEVSDIANAVLDGADAIMLSDETSVGNYSLEAVKILRRVISRTEHYVQKVYINF